VTDKNQLPEDDTTQREAQTEESKNTETSQPGAIPYDRFKEVNDRAKSAAAELEKIRLEVVQRDELEEKNRQSKLKEQAKWEELASEWEGKYNETAPALQTAAEDLKKHKEALEAFAASQLELVPELYRPIVQAMPVLDRLDWLTNNQNQLSKPQVKGIPVTPEGGRAPDLTHDKRRARAARTF
jgi:hypothetical protein